MFAQFFGGYLLNKGLVKPEDLTTAIEDKKNTRMRLGVLAINAGLMTAQQVEHVNITQQSVDKRFGDLAVELGYDTDDDVERLLSQQPTDYLLLGQTLVNNGVLTNSQFESAINAYKEETQFSDEDISENQNEVLARVINDFYHFDSAENARIYTDYVTLLFKNVIRFIGDDFTPLKSYMVRDYDIKNLVKQEFTGSYTSVACIAADDDAYKALAERFSKESFTEIDGFVDATIGEFLNVVDGLFAVNESNEYGVELTMNPQEVLKNTKMEFSKSGFCIPVQFGFGTVDFIICNQ